MCLVVAEMAFPVGNVRREGNIPSGDSTLVANPLPPREFIAHEFLLRRRDSQSKFKWQAFKSNCYNWDILFLGSHLERKWLQNITKCIHWFFHKIILFWSIIYCELNQKLFVMMVSTWHSVVCQDINEIYVLSKLNFFSWRVFISSQEYVNQLRKWCSYAKKRLDFSYFITFLSDHQIC